MSFPKDPSTLSGTAGRNMGAQIVGISVATNDTASPGPLQTYRVNIPLFGIAYVITTKHSIRNILGTNPLRPYSVN